MKVSDEVRDILSRSVITATALALPPEQLDRATYEAVNKVLKAAGGKWDKKSKTHIFPRDPREALGLAVEQGTIVDRKKELQAFYTPDALAIHIVAEHACLQVGDTVLEPSAGQGALVRAIICGSVSPVDITAIDIDPESKHHMPAGVSFIQGDFLEVCKDLPLFDVVVTNPPFTKGQAVAHVHAALSLARRTLVAIMPPTWTSSTNKRDRALRDELDASFVWAVYDNPPDSFKESGTSVNTVTLVAERI